MHFSSKKTHNGYKLSFGISDSSKEELLLVAAKEGQTLGLVPARAFNNMLPHEIVRGYIHWYDRKAQAIEFRMRMAPWTASPTKWRVRKRDRIRFSNETAGSLSVL